MIRGWLGERDREIVVDQFRLTRRLAAPPPACAERLCLSQGFGLLSGRRDRLSPRMRAIRIKPRVKRAGFASATLGIGLREVEPPEGVTEALVLDEYRGPADPCRRRAPTSWASDSFWFTQGFTRQQRSLHPGLYSGRPRCGLGISPASCQRSPQCEAGETRAPASFRRNSHRLTVSERPKSRERLWSCEKIENLARSRLCGAKLRARRPQDARSGDVKEARGPRKSGTFLRVDIFTAPLPFRPAPSLQGAALRNTPFRKGGAFPHKRAAKPRRPQSWATTGRYTVRHHLNGSMEQERLASR
jgi:hypothetical protein